MDVKKINFKDKKYVFPAILYPIVLFIGYFVIDMVQTDVSDNDPRLKTTDYLNSDLPEANTDSVLGGKLDNAEREYGQINDLSGVDNVEDDRDSVNKKEDFSLIYVLAHPCFFIYSVSVQESLTSISCLPYRRQYRATLR